MKKRLEATKMWLYRMTLRIIWTEQNGIRKATIESYRANNEERGLGKLHTQRKAADNLTILRKCI